MSNENWLQGDSGGNKMPLPFDVSVVNRRIQIKNSEICIQLAPLDAKNLVAALNRTLDGKLDAGLRLPLTTDELELNNFSQFVNFKFNPAGSQASFFQVNKEQIPELISDLKSCIDRAL